MSADGLNCLFLWRKEILGFVLLPIRGGQTRNRSIAKKWCPCLEVLLRLSVLFQRSLKNLFLHLQQCPGTVLIKLKRSLKRIINLVVHSVSEFFTFFGMIVSS
jgi:hypothetical protein